MNSDGQLAAQLYSYIYYPFAWWQHRFDAILVKTLTDRHTQSF